ncbi:hypothetical protein [Chryseolinea sp. H1M3-3]|uniref:hypothetical protein n=1 Tax=Chryseolinea sp. H1M3-3 TaxID=3034144 RepID=UPI0023EDCECC|nr:hypothetical protein [Chryseolinea sp. H1M3-3]
MKTPIIKNIMVTLSRKIFFFCLSMAFTAFIACSNEAEDASPNLSPDERETASSESQHDYYFNDADELAMEAFVSEDAQATGGKVTTDIRLSGAVVVRAGTFSNGSLKIDFGAGCTDAGGNVRKGLIILEHVGRWKEAGAQWTITFSGYSINGIAIEGTRKVTVTNVTDISITHDVELFDGKITWPDGTVATRTCHFIRKQEYNGSQLLSRLIVNGDAQGTSRIGKSFTVKIQEELVYDRSCFDAGVFIAVQGKKLIKHGDLELTIDYGDGSCDNTVTLTNKAGVTIQYEVSK